MSQFASDVQKKGQEKMIPAVLFVFSVPKYNKQACDICA
jgi:hypothetical protein